MSEHETHRPVATGDIFGDADAQLEIRLWLIREREIE
jgi:hypothetical protein